MGRGVRRGQVGRDVATCLLAVAVVAVAGCRSDAEGSESPGSNRTISRRTPITVALETLDTPVEVGPAANHPAFGLDRDAGVSAQLGDGSVVWFFGDTARVNPDWSLEYFVIGTAAWAAASTPTVTADALVDEEPQPFLGPDPGVMPCSPAAPVPGVWPYAAVVVQEGNRDRVLVWVENICLGQSQNVESRGMAVGEWVHESGDDHSDRRIELTPLGHLSPDRWYGYAAMLADDGWIYTYYCDRFPTFDDAGTEAYGPACKVARVLPSDVADPDRYLVLATGGWGADGLAAPLSLPPRGEPESPGEVDRPPGSFSVNYHRGLRRYVMAYSPWPGMSGELHVRFAIQPEGPWTAPQVVDLPGCSTRSNGREFRCYAGSLQPFLDTNSRIGIGYYDRIRDEGGVRGNYMVARLATH